MQALTKTLPVILAAVVVMLVGGCDEQPSAQDNERKTRQGGYITATKNQPAEVMNYSPTRESIRKWASTWSERGKVSFVYLQNPDGDLIGYYVFEGLPVSYCASLTPTYDLVDVPDDGDSAPDFQVPAPGIDNVYYGGGGSCDTYYGFDAGTGAYIEYTAGLGINVLLYDQPLPRSDVQPLGPSTVSDVKKKG